MSVECLTYTASVLLFGVQKRADILNVHHKENWMKTDSGVATMQRKKRHVIPDLLLSACWPWTPAWLTCLVVL